MAARLMAWLKGAAFRRALAVACALAILAAGFGHVHHFNSDAQAGYEVSSLAGPDGGQDAAPQLKLDHCHGCMMTAVFAETLIPEAPATGGIVTVVLPRLHPYSPIFENPPPIV